MRVLLINVDCGVGSTGKICTDMASELIKEGYEVKIAYGRDTKPGYKSISYRIGNTFDNYSHLLLTRIMDQHGKGSKNATAAFLAWAEAFNPDVLWLHNIHGYYINYQMLFSWIKSRPQMKVNWTLHDCWAFTGHCSNFTFFRCNQWKNGCLKCKHKHEYPCSFYFNNSSNNFIDKKKYFSGIKNMKIITPSVWLKTLVDESFLGNYPVYAVHNGIDTSVFKHIEFGDFKKYQILEDKKIILGVAGVWSKRKGLSDFVRLAELLPTDYYQVVIVGVNERQKKAVPSNIIAIKRTENSQELAALYSRAYVYVNLTYEDNYPTTNIEAIACGTPVITYRTGGSVESVSPECIVEQGDLDTVVKLIVSGRLKINPDIQLTKQEMMKNLATLL